MDDLPERSAEDTESKPAGREEILVNRALDIAARFYPNRESEHCKALARAIYSALLVTDKESGQPRIIHGGLTKRIHDLLTTLDTWYHDQAFKDVRAEAQEILRVMEADSKPPTDTETQKLITKQVWEKILYAWYEDYKMDRNVPSLFLRSDTVLRRLANLITVQLCEVRQTTFAEQVLNPVQREKLDRWTDEQNAKFLAEQQEKYPGLKRPYFGAIGGNLTWTRTPTSMGTIVTVIFCKGTLHEAELDLTEYSEW